MKRLNLFEPYTVYDLVEDPAAETFPHIYSMLVYVYEGKGVQWINDRRMEYNDGDLYVMGLDDSHEFKVKNRTRFVYLKLTPEFFQKFYMDKNQEPEIDFIIQLNSLKDSYISFTDKERFIVRNLIDALLTYEKQENKPNLQFPFYIISCLIEVIKKASMIDLSPFPQVESRDVIMYIQQHIYTPELIEVAIISKHFHIAKSNFAPWFKQQFGVTYKMYIDNYRLSLIENRLLSDRVSVKELVEEFAFTDVAHFSRYFKMHKGISLKEFLIKSGI